MRRFPGQRGCGRRKDPASVATGIRKAHGDARNSGPAHGNLEALWRRGPGAAIFWGMRRIVACMLLLLCRCGPPANPFAGAATGSTAQAGIILVVNDTLRADRAARPDLAPRLAAFAARSCSFVNAWTQAPWTKPSIATLFTSLYPSRHGIVAAADPLRSSPPEESVLDARFATLAEVLRDEGFATAAFVGNPWLKRGRGFEQGFDHYDDSFADWEAPAPALYAAALRWLEELSEGQRFFLYVHPMEGHRPYTGLDPESATHAAEEGPGPTPELEEEIRSIVQLLHGESLEDAGIPARVGVAVAAYEEEVVRADLGFGDFLGQVDELPLAARTVIVFTSDHGEALFERGYGNHGNGLYEDELAVPLLARFPGVEPQVIEAPVGLIDLYPTFCEYLGVATPAEVQGTSWVGSLDPERLLVSEGVWLDPSNRAVRCGSLKALFQPGLSPDDTRLGLFDLAADPDEQRNLLGSQPITEVSPGGSPGEQAFAELLRAGEATVGGAGDGAPPEGVPLSARQIQRLRELGYLEPDG